ncbi:MAG: hypothetical protein P4K83_02050 [Terracidiphilus sp.]|nr:hypothetical protein [Terracidiphilus sp.]
MSRKADKTGEPVLEPELEQALGDFRASVKAWSEVEYARPRQAAASRRELSWRLALSGAICLVLVAGTLGEIYLHPRGPEQAKRPADVSETVRAGQEKTVEMPVETAASEEARVRLAASEVASVQEYLASEDGRGWQDTQTTAGAQPAEDLLAGISSDVARQVPKAMEPLAQMMSEAESE